MNDKLCNFITLYRSPNQSQDDSESFIDNFELNLDSAMVNNPFLTVVLGDFNEKTGLWYNNNVTTYEGSKPDAANSKFGHGRSLRSDYGTFSLRIRSSRGYFS